MEGISHKNFQTAQAVIISVDHFIRHEEGGRRQGIGLHLLDINGFNLIYLQLMTEIELQGISGLTRLSLERTEVNDKGLQSLQFLTSLRRLSLAHCHTITDASLRVVNELALEWLDLTKCSQLTGHGVRSLYKQASSLSTFPPPQCSRFAGPALGVISRHLQFSHLQGALTSYQILVCGHDM